MTLFGKSRSGKEDYIDLSHYVEETTDKEAKMTVKVAEIQKYEDLSAFKEYVYTGNLLLLDYSYLKRDEVEKERIVNELKKVVRDINGDIAGLSSDILIVTPAGVKIDRRKARGTFF